MKKFECSGCENQCKLTPKERCFFPKFCPFAQGYEPVWHEVEDSVENARSTEEPFIKDKKLTVDVFDRPDCPEWANYAAVDPNGHAYFYNNRPSKDESEWDYFNRLTSIDNRYVRIDYNFDASDWENSLIKRPKKQDNKLPDWVKVGEWVYDASLREYLYVREEDYDWYVDPIARGRIKQARKRPFNDKEMKALVGKIITSTDGDVSIITDYSPHSAEYNVASVYFIGGWSTADELLKGNYSVDGKPCFKLEHLNEKGEWIE